MDYKEYAKDLLQRKNSLNSAYISIKAELSYLEQEKTTVKTLMLNHPDEPKYEDALINILTELDDCRFRRSVVERELLKIETGFQNLNEYQRDLLNCFFVESEFAADNLMERWPKERSSIYRDRNRALETFTRSIYGFLST